MNQDIEVKVKNIYGQQLIYVQGEHKEAINALTGKKTINREDANALRELGFTVSILQREEQLEI